MVDDTKEASRRHWVRWLTLGGSVSFLALVGPSCMYDKDKPCGDDLVVDKDANGNPRCVCPVGSVYSPTGCVECGPNQIVQGAQCVCDEGFMMGTDGTCQEVVDTTSTGTTTGAGGMGNSNSNSNTNGATTGASGAAGAGGEGGEGGGGTDGTETSTTGGATTDGGTTTSTTGAAPECTLNDDCAAAEICADGVCRPPTGWGTPCTAEGTECAGLEADFCDTFQGACTVSNCSNVPNTCPSGYDCCDLSTVPGFAIMCIPAGPYCPTPAP